jgi:quinol monooxygenase YgiN
MSTPTVSLHPYFKVHPGQLAAAQALLPQFVAKTSTEPGRVQYEFTISDDVVFCREAYHDASATLAHLDNVGALLGEMLKISELIRLEIHGPAGELEKLKGPLAELKPAWFVFECGLDLD